MRNPNELISMTIRDIEQIVMHAAKIGAMEVHKFTHGQMISRQQAYQQYGRTLITQLDQMGVISPHKTVVGKYIIQRYNIIEIEAALTAVQIDEFVTRQCKSKHRTKIAVGLKELADAYCCSYAKAKLLKRQLVKACTKQGRHIVVDLQKANQIVPMPPFQYRQQKQS